MRDGRLCGCIFSSFDSVTWGYMLPIELIFDSISQYWSNNFSKSSYPSLANIETSRGAKVVNAPIGLLALKSPTEQVIQRDRRNPSQGTTVDRQLSTSGNPVVKAIFPKSTISRSQASTKQSSSTMKARKPASNPQSSSEHGSIMGRHSMHDSGITRLTGS